MTSNETTIINFYTAFANADASKMCECYHPNIQIRDLAFCLLKSNEFYQMWNMYLEKSNESLKIN